MLKIRYETSFKKDYKRIARRGYDTRLMEAVISLLAEQKELPKSTKTMYWPATIRGAGSAISPLTGF